MTEREQAASLWADALTECTADRLAQLAAVLANRIKTTSPLGTTEGKDAVLASFGASPIAAFFAQGRWSAPATDADAVTITCTFPPSAPVGGVSVRLSFDDDGLVVRSDTTLVPAPPPTPTAVKITDAMTEAVNGALLAGTPVVVAYVDTDGRPHLSLRGSVQVFSPDQLAIWVRNPRGGLLAALPANPQLALFYRSPGTRATYQFHGRAHAESDEGVRDHVYTHTAEPERNLDPERRGVAVIVDIDRVEGRDGGGAILMQRDL